MHLTCSTAIRPAGPQGHEVAAAVAYLLLLLLLLLCLLLLDAPAMANNVQLVLANDPDADRLAAAEQALGPGGAGTGQFTTFSGNDIGLLLADWVWVNFKQRHPEVCCGVCCSVHCGGHECVGVSG